MTKINHSHFKIIGFLALALAAYIWTAPFRDLYSLEARNALMAREMIEGGPTFIPLAMGRLYLDYPPLYFWLEALFSLPFGHVTTLSAVLPSALSATGILALTFRLGREINSRVGWLAAIILATFPEFWLKAGRATIDMVLAFNVAAAVMCFYFRDKTENPQKRIWHTFGMSVFLILAFLTKGPVGLVLPGVVWGGYLLLERRLKDFGRFTLFMAFMGVVCVSGELAVVWKQGGMDLIRDVVRSQVTGRLGGKPNNPIYYYAIYLIRAAGPWWLWCIPAFCHLFSRIRKGGISSMSQQKMPSHPVIRLALVWFLLVFILFSLASVRHGRYLLPLFPALAILLALMVDWLVRHGNSARSWPWESILTGLTAMLVFTGWGLVLFFPKYKIVSISWIAVWSGAVFAGWFALRRLNWKSLYIPALMALALATGLSGANLLAEPVISKMESGRSFVEASENLTDSNVPVALYGIHYDREGVKYALYSSRRPETLHFISRIDEARKLPRPCLLIAYKKDLTKLKTVLKLCKFQPLAQGFIHSRPVVAYLLKSKETEK